MTEDVLQTAFDVARTRVPLGLVATWAAVGVVAAVIIVRLRNGDFGFGAGAGLLAIGGIALGLLCAAARHEASREPPVYKAVHDVVAERQALRACRTHLQVHGSVVPGSIQRLGTDQYRFRMESLSNLPPATLDVRYDGVMPDALPRPEILANGTLAGDGVLDLEPDGIMWSHTPLWRPN